MQAGAQAYLLVFLHFRPFLFFTFYPKNDIIQKMYEGYAFLYESIFCQALY